MTSRRKKEKKNVRDVLLREHPAVHQHQPEVAHHQPPHLFELLQPLPRLFRIYSRFSAHNGALESFPFPTSGEVLEGRLALRKSGKDRKLLGIGDFPVCHRGEAGREREAREEEAVGVVGFEGEWLGQSCAKRFDENSVGEKDNSRTNTDPLPLLRPRHP